MIRILRINNLFHTRGFSTTDSHSFTVSYLINSCGLPTEKAISAAQKVEFQKPDNPNSVLTLFRTRGFTDPHISQIVQRFPRILAANADKTLKPKLDFLTSIGLSGPDTIKMVSSNPGVLHYSLQNHIMPFVAYIKKIVGSDGNVVATLRRYHWILNKNVETHLVAKFDVLREYGVPDSNMATLLLSNPSVFVMRNCRFKKIVENAKRIGFDPSKNAFCEGISRLAVFSESTLQGKITAYKSWGWSEEDVYRAFTKISTCIALSKGMINLKMDFLVNEMGFEPQLVAKYPAILKYNLEKRIIPRCAVIKVLISNGVLNRNCNLNVVAIIMEKDFVKQFVTKYEGILPDLLGVYQRKMSGL